MSRNPLRGAGVLLALLVLILVLNRCSDWWDEALGPTSTGPTPGAGSS